MEQKNYTQKLKLFLNEPGFLKRKNQSISDHLERSNIAFSKSDKMKVIYPPEPQLERFKQLEQARENAEKDVQLDNYVQDLIVQFQAKMKRNEKLDQQVERKKEVTLGKLKMDYVQEQISQHLGQLQKLIESYDYYNGLIKTEKKYVEKMIIMTQIKKALSIQRQILKKQNEALKKQEHELDSMSNFKKKSK